MRNIGSFAANDELGATPDFHLDPAGNMAVSDGTQSLRERVAARLRFFRGEWPLDNRRGVPYFEDIFNQNLDAGLAGALMTEHALAVEGVTDVRDVRVSLDPTNRRMSYSATIVGEDGAVTVAVEAG